MSKIIREVRGKLLCGQNLFRRSTIEKMLYEYDRLLMRNNALEKQAHQPHAPYNLIQCYCQCEKCRAAHGEINTKS